MVKSGGKKMKENKVEKISLTTVFLILAIIIIVILDGFIYKLYNEKTVETEKVSDLNKQVSILENTVDELQEKIDSNTISNSEESDANHENSSISYIILEVEDVEAEERNLQGIELKSKKITDQQKIEAFMQIIDHATPYKNKEFIADLGDAVPTATIYLSNGESYTIAAGDKIEDGGNIVNLIMKWYQKDGSDKTLYKVDTALGEYIENWFQE